MEEQKVFRKRAQSGAWTSLVCAASEDEVLTLHDVEQLHPVLAALFPGSFTVEEVEPEEAAALSDLPATTIAELLCASSRPFAWALRGGTGSAGEGGALPVGTPGAPHLVQFFNLLEAALRRGDEQIPDRERRIEDALTAAAHALGHGLSLVDAALAADAAFAYARGQSEGAWRDAERALTGAAPDPKLAFAHAPNRLEQAVALFRAIGLWPW